RPEVPAPRPVEVRLGTVADPGPVADLAPDVVVVATGAAVGAPDLPGAGLGHVRAPDAVRRWLAGTGPDPDPGARIAVIGGSLAGIQPPEHLARCGHLVAVLEERATLAAALGW